MNLTVDQETGGATMYYSIPHGPCPSWSLSLEPTWLPVTLPCPWARSRLDGGCGGLPVSCPTRGTMRLSNLPGPGSRGHLGASCSSGGALCELQHPELPKQSPYSKARVKVLNGPCFDHLSTKLTSHWALRVRVFLFSCFVLNRRNLLVFISLVLLYDSMWIGNCITS